ncbi:hypothetical protein Aab01nite_74660 [Paractinoplanes abujensis]|nr:hypothetical protein Aab01nite_74660 [Actinoplanes abujensis]
MADSTAKSSRPRVVRLVVNPAPARIHTAGASTRAYKVDLKWRTLSLPEHWRLDEPYRRRATARKDAVTYAA